MEQDATIDAMIDPLIRSRILLLYSLRTVRTVRKADFHEDMLG
jgi:hypothetical protein